MQKTIAKVDKWFGNFLLLFSMPNGKVDEGEIALIIGRGGLKKATLARRKRIRAHFQAFTMENYQKDLTEPKMES